MYDRVGPLPIGDSMTHIDLLHRARTALLWPGSIDKQALIGDLTEAISGAYPRRHLDTCWCGVTMTDGQCNDHTDQNVGDG